MIFACRIKDGQVNFSNRYVQTNRLQQEKKAGHPLGLKVSPAYALALTPCFVHVLRSSGHVMEMQSTFVYIKAI